MARKVLVVLSGHGYWGEELIGRDLVQVLGSGLRRYGW